MNWRAVFVCLPQVKRQLLKVYPLFVALGVCAFLLWLERGRGDSKDSSLLQRLEWISHDRRVKLAVRRPVPTAAPELAAVAIDDLTMGRMTQMFPNDSLRWPFSHFYHAILIDELKRQGAKAVAFDVFFAEPDNEAKHPVKRSGTNVLISGQSYFADRLRLNGNVILAAGAQREGDGTIQLPVPQLATNASAVGHVKALRDGDGVFRRLQPFLDDPVAGRYWALGFELAARRLGLDLKSAEITPERIVLRGTNGITREVPLDSNGTVFFDWTVHAAPPMPPTQRVQWVKFEAIINSAVRRSKGEPPADLGLTNKLVTVGAAGTGVNVYDRGNTSVRTGEMMFMAHVNVANALLTGRFVRATPPRTETAITLGLVALATFLGWRLRTLAATLTVLGVAAAYLGLTVWCYTTQRLLLPVALPLVGALLTTHLVMTVCRMLESAERRRLEQLLKKVVSPRIIDALLAQETPMLDSRRLEITVFFADLRGFTRYAEESQNQAEAAARALGLPPEQAHAFADETAREAMSTVNRYLAAVADEIKASDGTLDKYMGDCVMAFWGAPVADPDHAAKALQCAIAAEQSLERLHRDMTAENERRAQENERRRADQKPPLPLLPLLRMGIGLNSGFATVGFMGSEQHVSNYTTFGHVVNVASRVEGLTGGGQIIATEHTVRAAGRNHPALVARCVERVPVLLKGVTTPVKIFEVQWQPPGSQPAAPPTP